MTENRGAFYIPAEDKTDTTDFTVPGDLAGETPKGNENPAQNSYSIDNKQRKHGKQYYVHVFNGWDVDIEVGLNGSSFDDEDMSKAVREQPLQGLSSQNSDALESDTGHSHLEVFIGNITAIPSSGTLEIVIQDRYR